MRKLILITGILLITGMMFTRCIPPKQADRFHKIENKWVRVQVAKENVRMKPNGKVIGKLYRGDSLYVLENYGNWLRFEFKPNREGYIWAPSCGFKYINLYNPYTYIDTIKKRILSFAEFKRLLGSKIDTIGGTPQLRQLEFKNIGLGEEVEEILNVAKVTRQITEKGVGIWYDTKTNQIKEVHIDLLKPVRGIKAALKKAGLSTKLQPFQSDNSQIVFKLFPDTDLYFILKRKQWKSSVISGFKLAYNY